MKALIRRIVCLAEGTQGAQYDADVQGLLAVIEQMRQIQQAARNQVAAGGAPDLLDPP